MRFFTAPALPAVAALGLLTTTLGLAGPAHAEETPPPPGPVDFIRTNPSSVEPGVLTPEWMPRAGAVNVTLVTIQTADRSAADAAAINVNAAKNAIGASSSYWHGMSGGRLSLTVGNTITGFKTSARSDWNFDDILTTVTRELGWVERANTALVVFMPRNDVVVYGQGGNLGAGWSGGATSGRVLMPYPGTYTNTVVAHEFGHVFGLNHSNSLQCSDGSADSAVASGRLANRNCYSRHYGNGTSLMGPTRAAMPTIDSYHYDLGSYGNGYEIRDVGIATGSKSYQLTPWAGTAANRALKFTDPVSKEVYYLEFRMPVGYDSITAVNGNQGVEILKADPGDPAASLVIPPDTRPYSAWFHPNLARRSGTFTTAAGTQVTIDYISGGSAGVTIRAATPYTSYFKYENSSTIYGRRADGSFKALTWQEYSSFGMPAYATLPAVSFVKNSWSSTIYAVNSSGKGGALSFSDWTSYGQPAPVTSQLLAGTYFYSKFNDPALYYASPAGETTATQAQWSAAGSPAVTMPSRYVKYPWENTIYKVEATAVGQSEYAAKATALSFSAWAAAGYPAPANTPFVAGSTALKYSNLATVFLRSPANVLHELSFAEWMAIPAAQRTFTNMGTGRFVKNSWSGAIYLVGDNNKGTHVTFEQWKNYGQPAPQVSTLIPGSVFVKLSGNTALYYDSPAGLVPASNAEYVAAGSPAISYR
jgi:hypothetical protein